MRSILLVVLLVVSSAAPGFGQDPGKVPTVPELCALMRMPIPAAEFAGTRTLDETLARLQARFRDAGWEVPIQVNRNAFQEENPDAAPIGESPVRFPAGPQATSCFVFLNKILDQVPTRNAGFLIRSGHIEITTLELARPEAVLLEPAHLLLRNRPLFLALQDFFEESGIPVVVDPHVGSRARIPITGTFTNGISLGTTLVLLAEMAGLKVVVADHAVFLTTPARAERYLRERIRYLRLQENGLVPGFRPAYRNYRI